jgi:hypothetical protein
LREALKPRRPGKSFPGRSFKELLLSIPQVGEDADFERVQDFGRQVDL